MKSYLPDLLSVGGLILIALGGWWIYSPLGLIILGLGMIGYAFLLAKPME